MWLRRLLVKCVIIYVLISRVTTKINGWAWGGGAEVQVLEITALVKTERLEVNLGYMSQPGLYEILPNFHLKSPEHQSGIYFAILYCLIKNTPCVSDMPCSKLGTFQGTSSPEHPRRQLFPACHRLGRSWMTGGAPARTTEWGKQYSPALHPYLSCLDAELSCDPKLEWFCLLWGKERNS